jgi:hypothetical protein
MQSEIQKEIMLLLEIDNVHGTESVKTLAICAKIISNEKYMTEANKILDNVFNQNDFNFSCEIGCLVSQLLRLNRNVEFYKEISEDRMKYVLYCIIYFYLFKHQSVWLSNQQLGTIRLLYCNVYDLLMIKSESIKLAKSGCVSFIARRVPILSSLIQDKIFIE